jgi:uncharacterized membrane protein YfcA
MGGIIHGAFASGGPLIVIYSTQAMPNKSNFRATLSILWLTLNTIIIGQNIAKGAITPDIIRLVLWSLPFLLVGVILGNIAHKKIKDNQFTKLVYVVLLLSAFFMFI